MSFQVLLFHLTICSEEIVIAIANGIGTSPTVDADHHLLLPINTQSSSMGKYIDPR
jgi:hypothetical protein